MTGATYREAHELPASGALSADGTRQALSEWMRAKLADDPGALEHLLPYLGAVSEVVSCRSAARRVGAWR
jgi:hypothetical protein